MRDWGIYYGTVDARIYPTVRIYLPNRSTPMATINANDVLCYLNKRVIKKDNPNTTPILKAVVEDSYKRLIGQAIEREIRSDLTDKEIGRAHV